MLLSEGPFVNVVVICYICYIHFKGLGLIFWYYTDLGKPLRRKFDSRGVPLFLSWIGTCLWSLS